MARTIRGNLTGRAAQIERSDLIQKLREEAVQFQEEWWDVLNKLKDLDPAGWEKWFDSCPQQTCGEMLPIMKEHVEQLEQQQWLEDIHADQIADAKREARFGKGL